MLTLRRFMRDHLPDPVRSGLRELYHGARRWRTRRARPPEESFDLVFVTPPLSHGWILQAICAEIGKRFGGSWTIHPSKPPFPKARAYFFAHYWTYLNHRRDSPWFKSAELFVWFTHPGPIPYSERELIDGLNESAKVLFPCTQFARMMVAKGLREDRAAVILGAADPELFRSHARTGEGAVGLVSAFYERKHPDKILEIVRRMPHRRFLLIGRNWRTWRRFDELAACANFTYREIPYEDYPAAYAEMDVFLSPSLVEGGPIPLVEAMMCNVVPVASSTGFAPDLITNGRNGFLFPPDAGAETIRDLIEEAFALQSDVRETVERYSWDRFAGEVLKFLPPPAADERTVRSRRSGTRIGWYVPELNPRVASMRYRCFLPAARLKAQGFEPIFITRENLRAVQDADVLIIVKYFDPWSLAAAHMAHDAGVPVVLDQCENIWDPAYRATAGATWRKYFDALASIADGVVVPTEFLAEVIRRELGRDLPVRLVRDSVESEADWREVVGLLKAAKDHQGQALAKLMADASARRSYFRARRRKAAGPPAALPGKRILWFGNHGSGHGEGMLALLRIAPVLERISRDIPLHLLVVSNSREKFVRYIEPLPFPTAYVEWDPIDIHDLIRSADLCVVPNPTDDLTRAKSANRITLALSHGTPVAATMLPALEPLKGCIVTEDWECGIRGYLSDPRLVEDHLKRAATILETRYSGQAVARQWADLLRAVRPVRVSSSKASPAAPCRIRLLVALTLPQDIDVLRPAVAMAQGRPDLSLTVAVPHGLLKESPRTYGALLAAGIVPRVFTEKEILAGGAWGDERFDALLTAAESNLPAHRLGRALTEQGNARNLRTYTVQHGYENVGLTYFDELRGTAIEFASSTIFTWQDLRGRAVSPPAEILSRCVPVGCPKSIETEAAALPLPPAAGPTVVVFENLHWHRYSGRYRDRFLSDLHDAARALPDWRFLVKPHHSGRWLSGNRMKATMDAGNLILADPAEPTWEPFTAPALITHADAVISTPSTTAVDAARAGKPVAVAAYDLALPLYEPLPALGSFEDWLRFLEEPDRASLMDRARSFVEHAILPGDGAARLLDRIVADIAARRGDTEARS